MRTISLALAAIVPLTANAALAKPSVTPQFAFETLHAPPFYERELVCIKISWKLQCESEIADGSPPASKHKRHKPSLLAPLLDL